MATNLRRAGVAFLFVSVLLIFSALTTDTTNISVSSNFEVSSIHNVGLLQKQMVFLQLGVGCLIAGAIFLGFGVLSEHSVDHRPAPEVKVETTSSAYYRDAENMSSDEINLRDQHRRKVASMMLIIAIVTSVALIIFVSENSSVL